MIDLAMKCDLCESPAVVHELRVKGGVKTEVHLCQEHAAAAGVNMPGKQPIKQLLTQFVICKGEKRPGTKKVCRTCGTTLSSFRQSGVLGCADCYDTFEEQLGPLIERAQNGAASHAGKCPTRGGESIDRQLRIQRLFKELEHAVAAEQYERAAELRDRLRDLEPDVGAKKSSETQEI